MSSFNFAVRPTLVGLSAIACAAAASAVNAQALITNGPGQGTVTVTVDGYGSFGRVLGTSTATDALYQPIGASTPGGTTFQSALAFRAGGSGERTYLTNGLIGDIPPVILPLSNATNTSPTSATSTFTVGGVTFNVNQEIELLSISPIGVVGSTLTQTYTMSSASGANFELIRYFDGDLQFDTSIDDSGGLLVDGTGTQFLFETDSGDDPFTTAELVAITATGGTTTATNRFEIDQFDGLLEDIQTGLPLTDTVFGDTDNDLFVDTPYDVTVALRNVFNIPAGGTATYTTTTYFGSFAPAILTPEPTSALGVIAGAGLLLRRRKA